MINLALAFLASGGAFPPQMPCAEPVPVYESGVQTELVCPDDLGTEWTLLDLSDRFAPSVFGEAAGGSPYRETFLALAARSDQYLELFGILPTVSVVLGRLFDEERHRCHDHIDGQSLLDYPGPLLPDNATAAAARGDPARDEAIRVLQDHLACDGLLRAVDGRFGPLTGEALALYRQRHMIPTSHGVDAAMAAVLLTRSWELEFRALLRVLRERVVHATGLIEDGSARGEWGTVLGRYLDAPAFRDLAGHAPLANGAPDAVAAATEAAARALGWTGAEAVGAFFADRSPEAVGDVRVVVRLPPAPAYHGSEMALRAEIDRGDVWYDYPPEAARPIERYPVLTLYAQTADGEVALVRWPTTIGGWQREQRAGGDVVMRYKGSTPGDFVWTDVVGAPAWFPPPTTPDRELVRRAGNRWVVRLETLAPGYRSAYGLVLIVHRTAGDLEETGVRTHGSVSYRSIPGSGSHGCHRLHNHLALRLGAFLLAHRRHRRHGNIQEEYERVVRWGGIHRIHLTTRGYRFELEDPVPVRVLEGRVRGKRKSPYARAFPAPR